MWTFFAALLTSILVFLSPFLDQRATTMPGSSRIVTEYEVTKDLYRPLPAEARAVTAAELVKIRRGTWEAVARPGSTILTFGGYHRDGDMENGSLVMLHAYPNGGEPEDLQALLVRASCDGYDTAIYFEGATMKRAPITTATGVTCTKVEYELGNQIARVIDAEPEVHVTPDGLMWLVTDSGAVPFRKW